uniref:Protein kinase domain-containing protein n=1 Tax=viral metagenome TaxID=1070528 RepID=A0A6C0HCL7_9ZZZZ
MTTNHTMINYEKRKNTELFKSFQEKKELSFSSVQNYIPIFNKFFSLTPTNFNSINLNNKHYIYNINSNLENSNNVYNCFIKTLDSEKVTEKEVFFKFAPLIDPFKFLIGKYNVNDESLYTLPKLNNAISSVHPKLLEENNASYVDSFFSFLSSKLVHNYRFVNGVDFYGSFLGIKNGYKLNVIDDIEYLNQSDFFNKNKNVAFDIEDYSFVLNDNDKPTGLAPIKIDHAYSNKSILSLQSISENLYEDLFILNNDSEIASSSSIQTLTEENLREHTLELVDMTNSKELSDQKTTTIKSGSTCSSRTSHTSDEDCSKCDDSREENNDSHSSDWESNSESETGSENSEEQSVEATIPRFPVNIICMENCKDTFDNFIANEELTQEEWLAAFMQIIMILITYQKCFSFTHNDLHTNNVMYVETDRKYLYYCYNKKYYRIPTFGKIFKIIDFGRSIYKFDGKLFCSDSFQPGADAATQYNTEPYFNDKKPRLEPNYSFDLCRLACSIFDYVIEDLDEVTDLSECAPVVRLVYEWCLDDNGVNILYKNNGMERYPDFKLYKMIARCVHNHTPQAQLERKEFKIFQIGKKDIPKTSAEKMINIDEMPNLAVKC